MTRMSIMVSALLAVGLSACGEPQRDVQYWLDHPEERFAVLAECRESAAAQAEHNARFRATWTHKMGFDPWHTASH